MIKAVIFDMDGVLIDAKDWHYEALNRALGLFGFEIGRDDHLARFDGLPTRRKLDMLSAESGLPRALHGFVNELKQQYTMELVAVRCKPTFIHEFALSRLKAKGYRLVVASNSIRETVEVMMQRSGLNQYLDVVLSASDVERAKPDPEIYQTAVARLGLDAEECLVVEDNVNGIAAAEAAGAHVYAVRDCADVTFPNLMAAIARAEAKAS